MLRLGTAAALTVVFVTDASAQRRIWTLRGLNAGDQLGSSVSATGDVDGDGHGDFIVGAPFAGPAGSAFVYSGKDASVVHVLSGQNAGDLFGAGVSYVGDLGGDGSNELVVGAPQTANTKLGYVQVFDGKTAALVHTVQGFRAFEQLGAYVANVDDVNDDGVPDFAAGAPAFIGEVVASLGTVLVCSGADGSIIYDWRGDDLGGFGYYMRCAGDVNADGVLDIVTGAPFDSTQKTRAGMARVFSGGDGSIIHTLYGENEFDHFGVSTGGMFDVDGDGCSEFLVGSYGSDLGGPDYGAVWMYSGRDATPIQAFHGDSTGEDFGFVCSGLKDVSGDGIRDVLIGARFDHAAGFTAGSARIYSGISGNLLYEMFGDSPEDQLGRSVKYAGDVDGDGFEDAIVGAYFSGESAPHAGKAVVFAGDDLFVNASRKALSAGDSVTLTTAEGIPGAPTLLAAVEVNGSPIFHPVGPILPFDADGVRSYTFTLPAGLGGLTVGLRAYAINGAGRLIDSSVERVLLR